MNYEKLLIKILIAILVVYVGYEMFIAMVKSLWELSPITSIGFVLSIIIATLKGHIRFDKLEENLRIMLFIFGGTIVSYAATSMIPNLVSSVLAGQFIGALITGVVILLIWFKGREVKGWE
jgi:hypothetical protein